MAHKETKYVMRYKIIEEFRIELSVGGETDEKIDDKAHQKILLPAIILSSFGVNVKREMIMSVLYGIGIME